ncbi:hypothetical protein CKJ79_15220 [Vibrio coralliilyticus]|nr:hypothetical protein CKJ79_15220 [Vibrio coralliilyticus]
MGRITMEKLTDSKTVPAIHSELHALLNKHTSTSTAILGLGGIGCKVMARALKGIPSPKCTMLAVNTDSKQFDDFDVKHFLSLHSADDDALISIVDNHETIIVISGAGGIGETLTRKLLHMTGPTRKRLIPLLYKPFEFEGIKRNEDYLKLLQHIRKVAGGALVFDNQASILRMNPNCSFLDSEQMLLNLNVELIKAINGGVHTVTKDVIQSLLI